MNFAEIIKAGKDEGSEKHVPCIEIDKGHKSVRRKVKCHEEMEQALEVKALELAEAWDHVKPISPPNWSVHWKDMRISFPNSHPVLLGVY